VRRRVAGGRRSGCTAARIMDELQKCALPQLQRRMRLCVTKAQTMDDGRGAGATCIITPSARMQQLNQTLDCAPLTTCVYNMCLIPFRSTDRLRRRIVNNWSEFNDTAWLNGVCTVALTAFNPGLIYYTATPPPSVHRPFSVRTWAREICCSSSLCKRRRHVLWLIPTDYNS
jgi:hypothetical protein